MIEVKRVELDNYVYEFSLDACGDDMSFEASLDEGFFRVLDDSHHCAMPEVTFKAIDNYQVVANVSSEPGGIAYASWIADVVTVSETELASLGPIAVENQARIYASMSQGDFGEVAFYANENAALARQANRTDLAIGYAAFSYDSGYRAIGIEPSSAEVPLIALDPLQHDIPVPTPEGLIVLEKFNDAITGRSQATDWDFVTTNALRSIQQVPSAERLKIEQVEQLNNLYIDPNTGAGVFR